MKLTLKQNKNTTDITAWNSSMLSKQSSANEEKIALFFFYVSFTLCLANKQCVPIHPMLLLTKQGIEHHTQAHELNIIMMKKHTASQITKITHILYIYIYIQNYMFKNTCIFFKTTLIQNRTIEQILCY